MSAELEARLGGVAATHRVSRADATVKLTAHERKAGLVLTDDLRLRSVVKRQRLLPVGTLGILLRAGAIGVMKKDEVLECLDAIPSRSSLFITLELLDEVRRAAEREL